MQPVISVSPVTVSTDDVARKGVTPTAWRHSDHQGRPSRHGTSSRGIGTLYAAGEGRDPNPRTAMRLFRLKGEYRSVSSAR